MREARTPNRPAGLGQCMLDCGPEATSRSRRQRVRSLVISVLMQALLLAALVVAPLLAAGKVPLQFSIVAPVPPYYGLPAPLEPRPAGNPRPVKGPSKTKLDSLVQPIKIPTGIVKIDDHGAGNDASAQPDIGIGPPVGSIPVPPGMDMTGLRPSPVHVAPPAPRPTPRLRITTMNPAQLQHRVDPPYPQLARQARIEGEVRMRAIIGRDGKIQQLELLSGHPLLVRASLDAVAQWRYRPTLLNGEPVEVETTITIIFTLNR